MRRPATLLALAAGLILATTPAAATAAPTASLPADLQQLLTAATSLAPSQITVNVRLVDLAHPAQDLTESYASSDMLHGGELALTTAGQTADSRFIDGREYDSIPQTRKLTDNHVWVYKPDPALAKNRDPAGTFDHQAQAGLVKLVQRASAVTETGPTTVAGQPATAFALTMPSGTQPVVVDIAPSGQLLSLVDTTAKGTITATISTAAPVQVTPPPASSSIALARLPKKHRSAFKQAVQGTQLTEGLLIAVTFGLG